MMINPFGYMTGTAWYLIGVIFWAGLGTLSAVMIARRSRRGQRNLRESLTKEQYQKVAIDARMHYVVWVVRAFQVFIAGFFALVGLGQLSDPTDQRWRTVLFVYLACLFMVEPFIWTILGWVELWLGRKSRWK